jgi:hypothetical protein
MEKAFYWKNVCDMQKKQTMKGYSKYGQILEENFDLRSIETLTYLQEELIDALMYIEHFKHMLEIEGLNMVACDECKGMILTPSKYCPCCGVKLKGDDDNE